MSLKHKPLVLGLLLAAGRGTRYGAYKQFVLLNGKILAHYSMDVLQACPGVDHVFLMVPDDPSKYQGWFEHYPKLTKILIGGKERFDTVRLALKELEDYSDDNYVLIHDAGRPLVTQQLINRCLAAMKTHRAASAAIPSVETPAKGWDGRIQAIIPRQTHYQIQTPQVFHLGLLREAHRAFVGKPPTEDCGVLLSYDKDLHIQLVEGDIRNMKITFPQDIFILETLLRQKTPPDF